MSDTTFVQPDIDAMTAVLDHRAQALIDQGGALAWGVFRRGETARAVNADVPYRIASMTKSFTAAAMGFLSAHGLDLDLPFARIIPDLAGTEVADRTCRQALTMGTGFAKDDPWADRVEAMTPAELIAHLHRGAIPIAPADTGYEYSNLGYALLGVVAEAVTGRSFIEIVTTEVLTPLGLTRTGFDPADFPDLVTGFRVDAQGALHPAEVTGPGVFSPIGGVISTVRDLGAWMNAHLDALEAIEDYAPGSWSRILADDQQAHRLVELQRSEHHTESLHYGFGLENRLDSRFGRVICHSGGYPGYGSHMRWFPELGLSIVVLGNTTYYPAQRVVADALDAGWASAIGSPELQLSRTTTSAPAPRYPARPTQVETVRRAANLVVDFDEAVADELFTVNMDLDEPRTERRARFASWAAANGLDRQFTSAEVTMTTALKGVVTVPAGGDGRLRESGHRSDGHPRDGHRGDGQGQRDLESSAPATITVSLDHLGAVMTIALST